MSITTIDLSNLPPADIIEVIDYEQILAEYVAEFGEKFPGYDVGALETDPVKMALEVGAYRETLLRARMNDVARANLLYYAAGADLDQLAIFYDVTRLAGESDERLRDRVVLAIAGRSPGGTAERYKFIAMSADVRIRDVAVWVQDPSPVVRVSVLNSLNGGTAYPDMLTAVDTALRNSAVQLVGDDFVIESAVKTTVNVTANVWMLPNALQSVFDALPETLAAQWDKESGLGFDLTRAWLTSRLMVPGVQKVELVAPVADTEVAFYSAVSLGTVTLVNKGRAF